MIEPCPVCGSADVKVRCAYRGSHPIFTGLKRAHCSLCGMVFANPMPQASTLEEYNGSYFVNAHGGQPRNSQAIGFFSGIACLRMAHIERYLNSRNIVVSTLLEFGPGTGFFARNWFSKYPETDYNACETDISCHASLQEMGVHLIAVSDLTETASPIDLVVMSHVLEHVSNPIEFLKNATQNLRKDGALFIEVPCRDWEHKPIDEPHTLFFDKNPMQLLLEQGGFGDIEVSYHGQTIKKLCKQDNHLQNLWKSLCFRLISLGIVAPFARTQKGMERLDNPLERAMVAPFFAHKEQQEPSWWLRALAIKK